MPFLFFVSRIKYIEMKSNSLGWRNMSHSNELIINIHLFKTAGTTLRRLLESEYDANRILLLKPSSWSTIPPLVRHVQSNLRPSKIITGHFGYNLWIPQHNVSILPKLKTYKQISYITMLRNPIDRKISEYFFVKKHYKNTKNDFDLSLSEYVNTDICKNLQTFYLSEGTNDLEIAKENLLKCKAVGITERFHDSVILLKNVFNWKSPINYSSFNVNKERPKTDVISQNTIKDIIKNNPLDMELYRFAQELFRRTLDNSRKSVHLIGYRSRKHSRTMLGTRRKQGANLYNRKRRQG